MPDSEYLFIHPWLHPNESWGGFHVECASTGESCAAALCRLWAHPARRALGQRLPWFIPAVSPDCLASIPLSPNQETVFLLSASTQDRDCAALRRSGIKLGWVLQPEESLPSPADWDYLLLSASHARTLPPLSLAALAARTLLAVTDLRSRRDFSWATANHCALISSEYLLDRSAPSRKPDVTRLRLLKLLALIADDADNNEIEGVLRQEPKLAYSLLRLVNSAAMGLRSPIASFAQAIALLGRQQLQRWLQLLVYADPNDGQHPNPLLLQAATRGRLMEILASTIEGEAGQSLSSGKAFMAGTFSLLDILLNLPMSEILAQLPLPGTVQAALQEHEGPLGKLLTALGLADNRDLGTASRLLADLGIGADTFLSAQLSALDWASNVSAQTA